MKCMSNSSSLNSAGETVSINGLIGQNLPSFLKSGNGYDKDGNKKCI